MSAAVHAPGAARVHAGTGRGWRWLLLLLFIPLPLAPEIGVPGATWVSSLCGLGWLGGAALVLAHLGKPARHTLWVWVTLFVFIMGYYVKFFTFAYGMGTPIFDLLMYELAWADRTNLNDALVWSTIGFLVFAVTATALLRASRPVPAIPPPPATAVNQKALYWILFLTLGGVGVSLIAALVFGFGQMGLEHRELPFHLDAVFTRFRITLAPAIFVTALWVADHRATQRVWLATIAALAVSAVLDAYVRGSRGSIAMAFLPLIFLWILSGTYTAARRTLTIAVVVATIALFPLFTALRVERITADKGGDLVASGTETSSAEGIAISLNQIAGRVVGIDSMMQVRDHMRQRAAGSEGLTTVSPSRLAWLANGGQMVIYMTHTVVGIPVDVVEGRSPGVLGGLYLVGGPDGMILFTALYAVILWLAWQRIGRHRYGPPLLAYVASVILSYTQEGVFGLENPISTFLAIVLVAWLFDTFVIARPRRALAVG